MPETTYPPSDHSRYGCEGMPNGKHGFCDCWAGEHHRRGQVAAEDRLRAGVEALRAKRCDCEPNETFSGSGEGGVIRCVGCDTLDDVLALIGGEQGEAKAVERDRERDDIADWLEGWSEGYDYHDREGLQTALKAFAGDIRDGVHRDV